MIICRATLTDWGNWAAIVAAGILILGVISGLIRWFFLKACPFSLSVEGKGIVDSMGKPRHYIDIAVNMRAVAPIESLSVQFKGMGTPPILTSLVDLEHGMGLDMNLQVQKEADGAWHWRYIQPYNGSRVRMRIYYRPGRASRGKLEVSLSAARIKGRKSVNFVEEARNEQTKQGVI